MPIHGNFGGGGAVAGGAFQQIATVTTSGSAASITFAGIPGTYADLMLTFHGRATGSGGDVLCYIQFNGDTTHYISDELIAGQGSSATAGAVGASNGGYILTLSGTSGNTDALNTATIMIPNYAGTTLEKGFIVTQSSYHTAAVLLIGCTAGQWTQTAAITQIILNIASGSFLDGTRTTLYGLGTH